MNKKVIAIFLLLVLIGGGIYFLTNQNTKESKHDKILKDAALDYFDKHISVYSGTSAYNITLKELKKGNYNLIKFKGCDEEKTYVTITIDSTNGKITKTKITKKC